MKILINCEHLTKINEDKYSEIKEINISENGTGDILIFVIDDQNTIFISKRKLLKVLNTFE